MGNPTPKNPIVLNDDGSISMLVYRARTLRLKATHQGLADPTGYKARFALTAKYGVEPVVTASTDDGTITLTDQGTSTLISVEIPDEQMDIDVKGGKLDLVLEEPGGAEVPALVGDWVLWRDVAP